MPLSEAAVQQQIMLDAPYHGATLWRNNVGACRDDTGRMIRYGLGNSSSVVTKKITSVDLVGMLNDTAQFLAIEVKREGWKYTGTERETAQRAFIELVQSRGGVAGFCSSLEDFRRIMRYSRCV
jgi:hypothetical protein